MRQKIYRSDRGLPLVYQGKQGSLHATTLTVESYIKWYDIYTVNLAGQVARLPPNCRREFEKAHPGHVAWSDHLPTHDFCLWLLTAYDHLEWDEPSLEMIFGRWQRERRFPPEKPMTRSEEIAALEKKLAELRAAQETESEPIRAVAEKLHTALCRYNHTDGCSWEYSDWNKPSDTRKKYYIAAEKLLAAVAGSPEVANEIIEIVRKL